MALSKESYNEFFVDRDGVISIRRSDVILEDGKEVAKTYHRKVLAPGDDVVAETDTRLKVVATVVWTPEVVDTYKAKVEAEKLKVLK